MKIVGIVSLAVSLALMPQAAYVIGAKAAERASAGVAQKKADAAKQAATVKAAAAKKVADAAAAAIDLEITRAGLVANAATRINREHLVRLRQAVNKDNMIAVARLLALPGAVTNVKTSNLPVAVYLQDKLKVRDFTLAQLGRTAALIASGNQAPTLVQIHAPNPTPPILPILSQAAVTKMITDAPNNAAKNAIVRAAVQGIHGDKNRAKNAIMLAKEAAKQINNPRSNPGKVAIRLLEQAEAALIAIG